MQFSLAMTFLTASREKATMTIFDVKADLTDAQVSALMDVIIAKGIFLNNGNAFVSKSGAQLIQKQTTKITL